MDFQAYFEEWSRLPGERVRLAVSTGHARVRASVERLVRGPAGHEDKGDNRFGEQVPGLSFEFPGRRQSTAVGSYAHLPLPTGPVIERESIHLWFWPTTPALGRYQALWAFGDDRRTVSVGIHAGTIAVRCGDAIHDSAIRVEARCWYSLIVGLEAIADGGCQVRFDVCQVSGLPARAARSMECLDAPGPLPAPCWARLATDELSSCGSPTHPFNGKIENPSWYRSVLTSEQCVELHCGRRESSFVRWIFEYALHGTIIHAEGAPAGELINGGDRGVTSHGWSGASDSFNEVPEQYAAVYFHDDDMVDAGWDYDLEFALPTDISSGLYAVRLEAEDAVDRYPFFVRAPRDSRADVLLLFPTNTYLAYANDLFMQAALSPIMAHERIVAADEQYLNDRAEFGRSAYDVHSDGSPVRYSSRRRPLVNVRPHYPNWLTGSFRHFAVDLFLIEWLERSGFRYHVATDEDLHQEGKALLERQAVVVTGSHPEYWTGPALNALEQYLRNRGRLMYLGGDGFYWVTTHHRDRPWTIEVRRDNGGLRSWDAPPGERTHVATGEPGGLWRYRGRGPNTICGIGFATEGFSRAQGYRRSEHSRRYPGDLFFEGIDADVVGEAGYILGGAAGDECDRFDLALGSPPQTQILASATGFGPEYLVVTEDNLLPMPNQDGPHRPDRVRSDMAFVPVDGGGGVFSVGSIAFAGAMAWNGFNNDCCRLADNVLRSFVHGSFIEEM